MSRGNPTIMVRVDPLMIAAIDARIAARNLLTRSTPWSRSDFIFHCIEQQLAKMERSRLWRKGKKAGVQARGIIEHMADQVWKVQVEKSLDLIAKEHPEDPCGEMHALKEQALNS
jgi:hypothetical protein